LFQSARQQKPEDPDLLYYFGEAASQSATEAFNQLAKVQPGRNTKTLPSPLTGAIGDLTPFAKALLEKPDDPDRLLQFATAAQAASKQAFEALLQKHAGTARAHQLLAERYTGEGRVGDAKNEYGESLRLQPYTAGVHLAFGKLLMLADNLPQALSEF